LKHWVSKNQSFVILIFASHEFALYNSILLGSFKMSHSQLKFENWRENGQSGASGVRCVSLRESNPPGLWMDDDCKTPRFYTCSQTASTHDSLYLAL